MPKVIEVIYENGVFKPLEKVELPQGTRVKVRIEEYGVMTEDFLGELRRKIKSLPKTKVDLKKLDEIYYEGKVLH